MMIQMVRFRGRGMALRPINSVKNIVDGVFLGVTAGQNTDVTLAETINDYTGANPKDVPIGAKVSSVYLFVQMISDGTGIANHDWYIMRNPSGVALPAPGGTGGSVSRKFILHEEKGIPGNNSDGAYPLTFKGVIRIPRGRQRMGEGDQLRIRMSSPDGYSACVKCIYKFYQ